MKGFIELSNGVCININHIISFGNNWIYAIGNEYQTEVKESYEEIKELIEKSYKP